jgi:signal transduction histidine kinase
MNSHIVARNPPKLHNFTGFRQIFSALTQEIKEDKPLSAFPLALAHEVRNPLTNINLALEMLTSTTLDDDQKLYLAIAKRASLRINGLITDLLSSSKPGEMASDKQCIHQLLDEVLAATEDRIRLKNITVRRDFTTIDCRVLVNKHQVMIALTNIIINAIDAMPLNTGKLILVTKCINGQCVISIEDNGIGISQENLGKIFKPFFTNKPGGMGLGLSTTLELLKSNYVRVEVKSEIGRGARFLLSFHRM